MRVYTWLALILIPLATLPLAAWAQGFQLIVHPSNSSTLDSKTVQRIFLAKERAFPGGGEAVPINLPNEHPARQAFEGSVVEKTGSQLQSYWANVMFTGKGQPPKEVSSEAEMLQLIQTNPSLIGYVGTDADTSGVKVISLP